ncbi:MAG: formate dehydrogenase accessory protein FdhE [Anaerolineae bacterium]
MPITEQDRAVLGALEAAGTQEPDLRTYYELHRTLFEMLALARGHISAKFEMLDNATLQARLDEGLPLLSFGQVPLEPDRFARLVSAVADVLVESNPDLAGQKLPASSTECLALARRRFKEGQAIHKQASVDLGGALGETSLAQVSVDLALKPYLEWAAEQVLAHVEEGHWKRDYCPACGGAPDLAFLEEESGTRHLLCSRCSSQWSHRRLGCPFCGTRDHTKLSYYLGEDEIYRLYVCQACRRYLKVIDLRKADRQVLLPVERITTLHMDVAAQQEGYR